MMVVLQVLRERLRIVARIELVSLTIYLLRMQVARCAGSRCGRGLYWLTDWSDRVPRRKAGNIVGNVSGVSLDHGV
jgi:hypothetical protein